MPCGVRGGDDPGEPARRVEPLRERRVAGHRDACEHVVVAREDLRRRVEHDVTAVLERAQAQGRGNGRVADHGCGMGHGRVEVGHREQRVRGRLDEDQVDAVRRRLRLVELDDVHAPRPEMVEEHAMPVVRARRERDGRSRPEQCQDDGRHRAHPRRVEEGVTAVECAERRPRTRRPSGGGRARRRTARAPRPRTASSSTGRARSPSREATRESPGDPRR